MGRHPGFDGDPYLNFTTSVRHTHTSPMDGLRQSGQGAGGRRAPSSRHGSSDSPTPVTLPDNSAGDLPGHLLGREVRRASTRSSPAAIRRPRGSGGSPMTHRTTGTSRRARGRGRRGRRRGRVTSGPTRSCRQSCSRTACSWSSRPNRSVTPDPERAGAAGAQRRAPHAMRTRRPGCVTRCGTRTRRCRRRDPVAERHR
jgi:hypothetical protein